MRCLLSDKGKFPGTQVQTLFPNLELKRSFEDEKSFVVSMLVERNSLLRGNSASKREKVSLVSAATARNVTIVPGTWKDCPFLGVIDCMILFFLS